MYRDLPAPIQRLFRRETGIFEPALIEEFSGAIRLSRPYQPRNGVNHEANVFRSAEVCGTMAWGRHPRIIVPFCDCTFSPIPVPIARIVGPASRGRRRALASHAVMAINELAN